MKAIHVFFRRDGEENALGIDLSGQGELHEDAIDLRADVEVADEFEELFGGDGGRGRNGFAIDAQVGGCFRLAADVDFGGGVIARQDYGKARRTAGVSAYTFD
jgi:hypothetical protein